MGVGRDTEVKVSNLYGVVSDQNAEDSEMTYQALPSRLHIKDSPIAGQGIFAKEDIPAGMVLGMSHLVVDEVIYRTPLGGFINHSEDPNCMKWCEDDKWFVKTLKKVHKGEELFLKYTFYKVG
jgi:hypothetical protein